MHVLNRLTEAFGIVGEVNNERAIVPARGDDCAIES